MMALPLLLVALLFSPPAPAPALTWVSMEEAQVIARRENRAIMIHFYADWCRYCKAMDKETFTDARVVQLLKQQFVLVRIDVESDQPVTFRGKQLTGRQMARVFRASSLPTNSFLDASGEPITYLPGKPDTGVFVELLSYVGSGAYRDQSFEAYLDKRGFKSGGHPH